MPKVRSCIICRHVKSSTRLIFSFIFCVHARAIFTMPVSLGSMLDRIWPYLRAHKWRFVVRTARKEIASRTRLHSQSAKTGTRDRFRALLVLLQKKLRRKKSARVLQEICASCDKKAFVQYENYDRYLSLRFKEKFFFSCYILCSNLHLLNGA